MTLYPLQGEKQMKIVVTANGEDLQAATSPIFGRCPIYLFVDTETMGTEAVANPALAASGGAGVQAAQFVAQRGAQAVLTGNVGPNAFQVFQAAGIPVYLCPQGTVERAVEAYRAGKLSAVAAPTAPAHAGMGRRMQGAGGRGRGGAGRSG
jgi:predicted Fe-Mo cluster-binding NifX family protein